MSSALFQPYRLHDLTLRNRIVLSPMTRGRAGAARLPNRLLAEYYAQRSSAGLLVTEGVAGHLHRRDDRRLEAHHQRRT
jgi:N-ethylmaleimide reductase